MLCLRCVHQVKSAQPEPVRRSSRRGAAPDAAIVDAVVRRTLRTVEVPAASPAALDCIRLYRLCDDLAPVCPLLRPSQTRLLPGWMFGSAGVPTRAAGYTGDGSRADSGIPPAALR
jgi:hypothetical protein